MQRRVMGAYDFAQLAANAIAIHGAGQGLAANDISGAARNARRGYRHELQVAAFDPAATTKYRVEGALSGQ